MYSWALQQKPVKLALATDQNWALKFLSVYKTSTKMENLYNFVF